MLGRGRVNALSVVSSPQIFPAEFSRSADLTGDGGADIIGFGDAGVWVSLSESAGIFLPIGKVIDNFAHHAGGWRVGKHPRIGVGPG